MLCDKEGTAIMHIRCSMHSYWRVRIAFRAGIFDKKQSIPVWGVVYSIERYASRGGVCEIDGGGATPEETSYCKSRNARRNWWHTNALADCEVVARLAGDGHAVGGVGAVGRGCTGRQRAGWKSANDEGVGARAPWGVEACEYGMGRFCDGWWRLPDT